MDQINKEGKYYWDFDNKILNNSRRITFSFVISNFKKKITDVNHCLVILCVKLIPPIYYFNCKDVDRDLLEKIVPLIHHIPNLLFFNVNHMTSNDVDILDSVFSEYFMSNYKSPLYKSVLTFDPEEFDDQDSYKLSNSNILA